MPSPPHKSSPEGIWKQYWHSQNFCVEGAVNTAFTKHAFQTLRDFIDADDKRILEAGSGTGRFCHLLGSDLPESHIVGMDYSAEVVSAAEQVYGAHNVKFEVGDLFDMPFPSGSWDVVFNEGVIEHFPLGNKRNYVSAVQEMTRVTRAKGKVIIAVPNFFCLPHVFWKALLNMLGRDYEYGYEKSFRPAEMASVMESAGLKVAAWRGFDPVHGLYRWGKLLPGLGRVAGILQRLYTLFRPSLGQFLDNFGFEFFMCGTKIE